MRIQRRCSKEDEGRRACRFICLVFLRGIRERAGDTWYPYRHHLIEAKQSDETNKREGMRAPFPLAFVVSPLPYFVLRFFSPPVRFGHSACSYKPSSLPVATFAPSPFPTPPPSQRSSYSDPPKIEYLCKLNGGGIDGRRQIEEVGREDNHMVRVNLGNNQEGRFPIWPRIFVWAAGRTITVG